MIYYLRNFPKNGDLIDWAMQLIYLRFKNLKNNYFCLESLISTYEGVDWEDGEKEYFEKATKDIKVIRDD